MSNENYKEADLTGRIIKVFYDVYNELGNDLSSRCITGRWRSP